ncbi:cbb3-type cytochrome oxidase assembly protein CcoS [Pseudomonas japonica]|uniref:cbb3-type cytochrome oxidase assembly protein CcoS n=1 Tax=Pseudomonas japonica TaxID=256466 RepID=UPI0015E3544B|nr:cbb3-type cytochrome oxidase assembly protein CcoS [Pseudomonas japonica]MBA1243702.1 cbb3-type cytochrome oxidase assembly protein CcoS [Pseudomonas japonica]MBA1287330.1 cbb3-type cytochrome oxidase assembly protein CcoS [Pseudomonas japonica]
MSALYYLIPAALLIVSAILWLFVWAVNSGQYDDLDSPARRLLMDEDSTPQRRREAPDD